MKILSIHPHGSCRRVKEYNIRKVLITGAGGFCACHLVNKLRKTEPIFICGTDLRIDRPVHVPLDSYVPGDITGAKHIMELVQQVQPDWIFHLAGLVGDANPVNIYRVNVLGTINLLEAFYRFAPEARMLLVGSAAEYGPVASGCLPVTEDQACNPVGTYGISKYAATMVGLDFARRYTKKIVIARPFNIIGAGVSSSLVLGAVLNRIKQALACIGDPVVKIGNMASVRDFIAVEDVVDAYIEMIQGNYWGEIFNICSGQPQTIQAILDQLVKNSPRPITFETDPDLYRSTDLPSFYGSNEKARRTFSFNPIVSIETALISAWNYIMKEADSCGS